MGLLATPDGARALRTHRMFMRGAQGTSIFAWLLIFQVFLFSYGFEHALFSVLILYTSAQVLAFFLTPLTAPALRFGVRRALAFGTLCAIFVAVIVALMFIPGVPFTFFTLLSLFVVFTALQRALYWIPYESVIPAAERVQIPELALMGVPLVSGVLITTPGAGSLVFIGAAICALIALVSLIRVPERVEAFEWSVTETVGALFEPRHRSILMSGILDGIQGAALLFVWPLVIFIIVRADWFLFGLIFSLSLLFTYLLRSHIQRVLKRLRAERSETLFSLLVLGAWVARLAAPAPAAILAANVFAHTTISPKRFGVDESAGEQAADSGHFIDEYTALKEMALHIGRIFSCLVCMILIPLSGMGALALTLALAGVASVVSIVMARRAARTL